MSDQHHRCSVCQHIQATLTTPIVSTIILHSFWCFFILNFLCVVQKQRLNVARSTRHHNHISQRLSTSYIQNTSVAQSQNLIMLVKFVHILVIKRLYQQQNLMLGPPSGLSPGLHGPQTLTRSQPIDSCHPQPQNFLKHLNTYVQLTNNYVTIINAT